MMLSLGVLFSGAAMAQTTTPQTQDKKAQTQQHGQKRQHLTPEQRATQKAERLSQQLNLSADQKSKVQAMYVEQGKEMEALRASYSASASTDKAKPQRQDKQALQEKWDTQLRSILTAEQYAQYTTQREAQKAKRAYEKKDTKGKRATKS